VYDFARRQGSAAPDGLAHQPGVFEENHMKKILGCCVLATVGVMPALSGAAPLSFLNKSIISRIPAADTPSLQATVGVVLNDMADGQPTEWTSSQSNRTRRTPVHIVLTPQQTVQTDSAGTCRLLDAKVSQANTDENWKYWFCKQADGSWKASHN